jgi:hypothetical protein
MSSEINDIQYIRKNFKLKKYIYIQIFMMHYDMKLLNRMRTAFNEDQVQIFQSYFNVEQNPDPQDLDTIADQAGVSRRVAQVWFQNARARSKKNMQIISIANVIPRSDIYFAQ